MESKKSALRAVLRWSIVVACAVVLWFVGYRMGGPAGSEQGHAQGFADAREEGLAAGRLEGIRRAAKSYRPEAYNETHEIGSLIDQRLAAKALVSPSVEDVRLAAKALTEEVLKNVFPEANGQVDGPEFSIRYMPGNRTFIVHTVGAKQAELALYLKSPEDFRIWKQAEPVDEDENARARIVRPRTSSAAGAVATKGGAPLDAP